MRYALLVGTWAAALCAALAQAAPPPPRTLEIETGSGDSQGFTLVGPDAAQQLLVTGQGADGRPRDWTRDARYEVQPADVAEVDATGLVTPRREGVARIRALAAGGVAAETRVTVTRLADAPLISVPHQVTPLFTKLGCNGGGCHGKADGQNGFKLSLLGFEPGEDFEYVVREARGRRVFPAAPDRSLLLRKASGASPHGGGTRLVRDSAGYRLLRRWVEQGLQYAPADDPALVKLHLFPADRLLDRETSQQMLVMAEFSDGSRRDVTRLTHLSSNQPENADVSPTGLVTAKRLPGGVAVLARYESLVDVYRATIPLGEAVTDLARPTNFIDEHVQARWKTLGLPPSPPCDEATFLRRATIDLCGRLPTVAEAEAWLADRSPNKHEQLLDRLLASDDYSAYFANKWSAILRNRRNATTDDAKPTVAFHDWIRDHLKRNTPYDQFVRGVLTATGEQVTTPPVIWFRELNEPNLMLEDTAQLFLGQRIQCARCHHHPLEKWSQQDYYGFQAFFSQVKVQMPTAAKKGKKNEPETPGKPAAVSFQAGAAQAVNPKTNMPVKPTPLGGAALDIPPDVDPRERLADWLSQPDNPYFARALVNRYWKHFFGRGLADPEDDLRTTNPAGNPALLDALARHFVERKFDLRDLVRTICLSQAYRVSAVPNAHNASDRENGSRFLVRRLNAEVLLDAIDQVTETKTSFPGAPAGLRAVELPDNSVQSYFLSVFGRPDAASACECERSGDVSLAQCLHMFNSDEIMEKISGHSADGKRQAATRAARLASDPRPVEARLRELYLAALSRAPNAEEQARLAAYLERKREQPAQAWEDILWAVLNAKEFMYNH